MSAELPLATTPVTGWRRVARTTENWGVTLALLLMMTVPVAESLLRRIFHTGISGAPLIVQQLTFVVGMLGGAIAARDGRLLALSALTSVVHGRVRTAMSIFSQSFAAAITAFLCVASVIFVRDMASDDTIAYGIQARHVQFLLPIGFAVIALRLWWHAAKTWKGRVISFVLVAGFAALAIWSPVPVERMKWPALGLLVLATMMGAPVFTTLGGAALILFWAEGEPIASLPLDHYRLTTNASLPTVPMFTLAGYFLAEGGASKRLVRVFDTLFGMIRGGPAIVTALVCAFFTSFTGGSGVTILALGGVLMPVLAAAKYKERTALGLLTGAGSLGILFPPCLPLILYAIIASQAKAQITIEQMFLGGIIPGLVLVGLAIWWGVAAGPKPEGERKRFNGREAWQAMWEAKWELLLPVVALVALFGGFATPVEAAAVTALYAFIVETFVYRDLKLFKDVPRVVADCGLLVGGVLLILGVALGFTQYLVDAQIPSQAVTWATNTIHSRWLFLFGLNIVLIFVGGLVEIYAAIVVVVPLLVPLGLAFQIDPIHLGIIFLTNMELGFLAPPVGLNLLLSSYRFNKPMLEVTRAVLPMLAVQFIGVLLITYIPPLTTWLPHLIAK